MKSTLLATLAHDLKTPLAAARASAENWERRARATRRSRARSPAPSAARRGSGKVDDLLSVARLESGAARPSRERVSCAAIAESRRRALRRRPRYRHALVVDVAALRDGMRRASPTPPR